MSSTRVLVSTSTHVSTIAQCRSTVVLGIFLLNITIHTQDLVGEPQRVVGETDDIKRETQSVRACQSKKTEYMEKGEMTAGAGRQCLHGQRDRLPVPNWHKCGW